MIPPILEWEEIRYGNADNQIPMWAADRIAAVAAASKFAGRDGDGVLEHGRNGLSARGVVGVIAAEGCVLEILPKIDFPRQDSTNTIGNIRRRLVHMLTVALDLKIDVGQITELDWQRETLLEILIRLFSEKLADAVRRGMPRHYVEHTDDLPTLRGRLNVMRQFTTLAAEPSRLACRYDELTTDIALNRIMKAAVARLSRIARTGDNQRRLRELALVYADVANVPVSALRWDQVILDRTNNRWRELLNLARLLLGNRLQTTSTGRSNGFSLLFEMNTLFEKYISEMLKYTLAGTDLRVISQGGLRYCLETEDGGGLFQTKPDILIKRGDDVVQIIDAKWKRIAARNDDPKCGVSQSDIYQMMAYGRLYQCSRLTLLYPHHNALQQPEEFLASHRIISSDHTIEFRTFDISNPESIKERIKEIFADENGKTSAEQQRDAKAYAIAEL